MNSLKSLAQRVRITRQLKDMTATELGKKAGKTRQAISLIEKGATKKPDCIMELADALGVSAEWLVFGRGDGPDFDLPAVRAQQDNVAPNITKPTYSKFDMDKMYNEIQRLAGKVAALESKINLQLGQVET